MRNVALAKIRVPDVQKPVKIPLVATLGGTANSWDFWVFPKRARRDGSDLAVSPSLVAEVEGLYDERNVQLGWWWMRDQIGTALLKHPVFGDLPHEGVLSPLLFRIVGKGFPLIGGRRDENDLFMVGEGGADCYTYLARRRKGKGVVYESFGLGLLSGKPERPAIIDGMIDCARGE